MARIPRLLVKGEDTIYHIMSRTALPGYVLGDVEKDYLLGLIKNLSDVFFVDVFGFCIMGNHFHLLFKMNGGENYDNGEVKRRVSLFRKCDVEVVTDGQVPIFKEKFSNLSEFMKELKQRFSRYYNKGILFKFHGKQVILCHGGLDCATALARIISARVGILFLPLTRSLINL